MIQNDQRYNKIMFLRKILSKPSLLAAQYILSNQWDWSFDVSKKCSDILGPTKMFNNYYPGWWRDIESEPPLLPPASSWGSRDSSQVHQRLQDGHQVWLLTIFFPVYVNGPSLGRILFSPDSQTLLQWSTTRCKVLFSPSKLIANREKEWYEISVSLTMPGGH